MVLSYFPPFPSKRCMSLSEEGTLAYGHKNTVVHLKGLHSELGVFRGNSRVNALEWSPTDSRLALGCEDGQVLLLSKDLKLLGRHEGHGSNGVLSISWGAGGILFSLDSDGGVISYTPTLNHIDNLYKPLSSQTKAQILAAHPIKPDIYALSASKLIYILNKSKVLKFLKQHGLEITSLLWCESRLASASAKEILLWDPLESNHCTHKLNTPNARIKKEVHLAWPAPGDSLISASGSLILKWDLATKKSVVVHSLHNPESNVISLSSRKTELVSLASDNHLISYELASDTHKYTVPTISHGVLSLLPNPIEGSTMAIGAGDGKLRIWNTIGSSQKGVQTFWKFKMMKIIAMAWHPLVEGLLGLGTQEGCVCTIDITSRNPEPDIYEYKHKGSVYKVFWGASQMWKSSEGETVLYSLGDGLIVKHKSRASYTILNEDPASPFHSKNESNSYSDVDLKPLQGEEGITFALGHVDGTVSILCNEKFIASLKYHQKLVYCTTWHPIYYNHSDDISQYSNWLAVSTNESNISVWNLDSIFSEGASESTFLTNPSVILKGHDAKVVRVLWSPHDEEKLLSISYDLSAQIWNAVKGESLANFRGHSKRLLSVSWSMTDPDVVYTGADDSILYTWKVSELTDKVPPLLKKTKKNAIKWNVAPATFDNALKSSPSEERSETQSAPGVHKQVAKPKVFEKNFFQLCTKAESEYPIWKDILELDDLNISSNNYPAVIRDKPHLQYFLSTENGAEDNFGSDEIEHNLKSSEFENAATLGVWLSGDLGGVIQKAMENGRLTDWLVSLAASVGHQLWMEACESYAEQLIKINGDHLKASTYFLMSQNPLRAVSVLKDGKFFRSAVSLIKGRLNSDAELLKSVYESWASFTSSDGRYELASRAWIAAGDRPAAASTLAKIRDSPKSLETAGILYFRHGDLEKAEVFAVQAGSTFVQTEDWGALQNLVNWAKDLKSVQYYFHPLVRTKLLIDESVKSIADEELLWSSSERRGLILTLRDLIYSELSTPQDYETAYSNFKNQSVFSSKVTYIEELILCALSIHSKERSIYHCVRSMEESLSSLGTKFASGLIHAVLPQNGSSDPPAVGLCLWGEPLAWQCRWKELDSLQCYVFYVKLQYFLHFRPEACDADTLEDISFNLMREDVVNSQKLLGDIAEAEEALREFEDEPPSEDEHLPNIGALSLKEPDQSTAHGGNTTQTMELNSEGEWKTVLAASVPPPSDPNMPDMPPPMGLTKSFRERFLYDRSEDTKVTAQKEIQKLKWEQSRTNVLTCPYPNITAAVKDILTLLEETRIRKGDPSQKILCRIKGIATWAYWKGTTKDQMFFLELT